MLRSTKEVLGYQMLTTDGVDGRCKDFLIDERHWTIRYIVVETGTWLSDRLVIVSPSLVGDPEWRKQLIPIQLSKAELEDAPPLDKDAPVSRRYEKEWLSVFNQPYYWIMGPSAAAAVPLPDPTWRAMREAAEAKRDDVEDDADKTYLRSADEIVGYKIHAVDGEIGEVDSFIMEDRNWTIRYLVVNMRRWVPGHKVLLSPDWIKNVSWLNKAVEMDTTVESIRQSPPYKTTDPVNRELELRLYDYYGRPKYWEKM